MVMFARRYTCSSILFRLAFCFVFPFRCSNEFHLDNVNAQLEVKVLYWIWYGEDIFQTLFFVSMWKNLQMHTAVTAYTAVSLTMLTLKNRNIRT